MEAGAIVDIKEYHRKYSLEKRNGAYAMVPGTPFVINVDGTYILLSKAATLIKRTAGLLSNSSQSLGIRLRIERHLYALSGRDNDDIRLE